MGVVNKNMRASRVAFAHIFVDHGALAFVVLCGVLVRRHLDKAFSGAQKACLVSRRDEAVLRLLCALIRACAPGRRRTTLTAQTEGRTEGSTDNEAAQVQAGEPAGFFARNCFALVLQLAMYLVLPSQYWIGQHNAMVGQFPLSGRLPSSLIRHFP